MERTSLLRRRLAGILQKSVEQHCRATGDRLEDIADGLGISPQYLANILHCHRDAGCPLDVAIRIARLLGDQTIIQAVVDAARPEDRGQTSVADVLKSCRESMSATDAAIQQALISIEDGKVTRDEVSRLEYLVPTAAAQLESLLSALKRMQSGRARAATMSEAEDM